MDRIELKVDPAVEAAEAVDELCSRVPELRAQWEAALEAASRQPRTLVIGGASVYRQFFPYLDRVYVTKIGLAPHSDSFFPDLDASPDWRCIQEGEPLKENGVGFRFCTYERVSGAAAL